MKASRSLWDGTLFFLSTKFGSTNSRVRDLVNGSSPKPLDAWFGIFRTNYIKITSTKYEQVITIYAIDMAMALIIYLESQECYLGMHD